MSNLSGQPSSQSNSLPNNFNEFSEHLLASNSEHFEYQINQFSRFLAQKMQPLQERISQQDASLNSLREENNYLLNEKARLEEELRTTVKKMEQENYYLRLQLQERLKASSGASSVTASGRDRINHYSSSSQRQNLPPPSYSKSPASLKHDPSQQQHPHSYSSGGSGHRRTNSSGSTSRDYYAGASASSQTAVYTQQQSHYTPHAHPTGQQYHYSSSSNDASYHSQSHNNGRPPVTSSSTTIGATTAPGQENRHLHHTSSPLPPPNVAANASYIVSPSGLTSSAGNAASTAPSPSTTATTSPPSARSHHRRSHSNMSSHSASSVGSHHASPATPGDVHQHRYQPNSAGSTGSAHYASSPYRHHASASNSSHPQHPTGRPTSSPVPGVSPSTNDVRSSSSHRQRPQTASAALSPSSRADLQKYSDIEIGSSEFNRLTEYEQKLVMKQQQTEQDNSVDTAMEDAIFSRKVQHPDQKFLPAPPIQTSNSPGSNGSHHRSSSRSKRRPSTPNRLRSSSSSSIQRRPSTSSAYSIRSSPVRSSTPTNRRASFGGLNSSTRLREASSSHTPTPGTPNRRHSMASSSSSSSRQRRVKSPPSATSSNVSMSFHTNTLGDSSSSFTASSPLSQYYFNPSTTHLELDLSNANRSLSHKRGNIWRSSLGNVCLGSNGTHEFTILVENTGAQQLRVGVADYDFDLSTACGDSMYSFAFDTKTGSIYNNRTEKNYYTGKIRKNSKITVLVDLDKREMSFRLNGENLGTACSLKKKVKYYPCVSLYESEARATFK